MPPLDVNVLGDTFIGGTLLRISTEILFLLKLLTLILIMLLLIVQFRILLFMEIFIMATKTVNLDTIQIQWLTKSIDTQMAVLKRQFNAESNVDIKAIRQREMSDLEAVKAKLIT